MTNTNAKTQKTKLPILKPKALTKGSLIGICAPAWSVTRPGIASAVDLLRSKGFRVYLHPHMDERHGTLAGDVHQRVEAVHDLFQDNEIEAILFARGGYGGLQLLEYLDFDLIKQNPKPVIGHSDNCALLYAIHALTGLVTFHGPNAYKLLPGHQDILTTDNMVSVISGRKPLHVYPDNDYKPEVVNPGEVEAPIMGGNHILLHSLIGTPYQPCFKDTIFFMESNLPKYYDVDQDMNHFRFAGVTTEIKGLIMGEMQPVHSRVEKFKDKDIGRKITDMAQIHHPEIPSVTDFPCGHHKTLLTFPLGIRHRMSLGENGSVILEQLESACE